MHIAFDADFALKDSFANDHRRRDPHLDLIHGYRV